MPNPTDQTAVDAMNEAIAVLEEALGRHGWHGKAEGPASLRHARNAVLGWRNDLLASMEEEERMARRPH